MRNCFYLAAILATAACEASPTGVRRSLAPATLSVTATTRAVSLEAGGLSLEVLASLSNDTDETIRVAVGPSCPLHVRLFFNPTGEIRGELSGSAACSMQGPTLELDPGYTAVLKRVFGPDTLATFGAGKYGVNVAVTTNTAVIGVWGGNVDLPLAGSG